MFLKKVVSRVNSSLRDKQKPTDGGRLGNVINETQRVFREARDGQEMKRNRQNFVNNETSAAFEDFNSTQPPANNFK